MEKCYRCGNKPKEFVDIQMSMTVVIQCQNCGCNVSENIYNSVSDARQAALDLWNRNNNRGRVEFERNGSFI